MLPGQGREKLELESALHKAIERDELVLHYQPKIDVRAARMVGVEALMRWQRGGTLVPPGDFIPLAEETGLIVPLSRVGAARGGAPGAGLAGQLRLRRLDRGQPAEPAVRAQRPGRAHPPVRSPPYGVPHRAIQLEITETNLMKDLQNVIPSLHRLNEIGVEISIDDFGTGYSSLAYLTTLPISELKIDRSFVRDLGITPQSSAVVTAIIALARSLGLRVIAEGVENLRQMDVLHRLGCGVMQGFLFSRPMPPDDLRALAAATPCCRARRRGSARPARSTRPSRTRADAGRRGRARRAASPSCTDERWRHRASSPRARLRRLAQASSSSRRRRTSPAYARRAPAAAPETTSAPIASERGDASCRGAAAAWAALIERLARGLERGGKQWTAGARKEEPAARARRQPQRRRAAAAAAAAS